MKKISSDLHTPVAWECLGRKQSLPEPGECNWPDCGCDPHSTKVIEALLEQGWGPNAAPASHGATALERAADAIDAARYAHPEHPRERPHPFAEAHKTDREYAFRLARAALTPTLREEK